MQHCFDLFPNEARLSINYACDRYIGSYTCIFLGCVSVNMLSRFLSVFWNLFPEYVGIIYSLLVNSFFFFYMHINITKKCVRVCVGVVEREMRWLGADRWSFWTYVGWRGGIVWWFLILLFLASVWRCERCQSRCGGLQQWRTSAGSYFRKC